MPPGRILVVLLQLQNFALECAEVQVERDPRQARRLGFAHQIEGSSHPAFGCDHVRPALQHLQRQSCRNGTRHGEKFCPRADFCTGIAAHAAARAPVTTDRVRTRSAAGHFHTRAPRHVPPQYLHRCLRPRVRGLSANSCNCFAASTISAAICRCTDSCVAVNHALAVAAAIDCRANSKSACAEAYVSSAGVTRVADTAPQIDLPRSSGHDALQCRRRIATAARLGSAGARRCETQGRRAALATSTYCADCSTRAAATRRSGLAAIASWTSASSCESWKDLSQLSCTASAEAAVAFHGCSSSRLPIACSRISSGAGGSTVQPPTQGGTDQGAEHRSLLCVQTAVARLAVS